MHDSMYASCYEKWCQINVHKDESSAAVADRTSTVGMSSWIVTKAPRERSDKVENYYQEECAH